MSVVSQRPAGLCLEIRLMTEPCLWCWEIWDVVTGHRVGSSWNDDWMAYDSSREVLLAAMHRLTEINAVSQAEPGQRANEGASHGLGLALGADSCRRRRHAPPPADPAA